MDKFLVVIISVLMFACKSGSKKHSGENDNLSKPNIIFILADDLGYGEIGVYGQDIIQTPNIDALANSGIRLTDHYTGAPVCAPARCILLTGQHGGHAYIRGNDEWAERGDVWNFKLAAENPELEGQRPIPSETVTLSKELQKNGYTCGIFGKWGLGAPNTEGIPTNQGFDYFYGYNCQRQAHNLYPTFLWENEQKVFLDNELVIPNTGLDKGADTLDPASYAKFTQKDYAPTKIHEKALEFIDSHVDDPFFMYYASPLPHLPLQAPKEEVDKYRDIIGNEEVYLGDDGYFPCPYPRATYAAMIGILDQQVGDLIQALKEKGIYDNTIIIFSSDNGPTYLGGVDYEFFASSAPFTNAYGRTKGFVYEGGIRVPFIASWPGRIKAGSTSNLISSFYDMFPTICDLVDIDHNAEVDGISLAPTLLNEKQETIHDYLYWEFPGYKGQQAVRIGHWKAVRKNIRDGKLEIELYDLHDDPHEEHNLAHNHPDLIAEIERIFTSEHERSSIPKFQLEALGD